MIALFILGALAAWGTPQLEPQIKALIGRVFPVDDIPAVEMRGISLSLLLLVAALLGMLFGSYGAIALALGAIVGATGPHIYNRSKAAKAPDYDS